MQDIIQNYSTYRKPGKPQHTNVEKSVNRCQSLNRASLRAQLVKNPPAMQGTPAPEYHTCWNDREIKIVMRTKEKNHIILERKDIINGAINSWIGRFSTIKFSPE